MGLFMYQSQHGFMNSTQAYLGSVRLCPSCCGQKPKDGFRMHDGQEICKDCRDEALFEMEANNE